MPKENEDAEKKRYLIIASFPPVLGQTSDVNYRNHQKDGGDWRTGRLCGRL